MKMTTTKVGSELTIAVDGRVDVRTAPQLSDEVTSNLDGVTRLIFDFKDLVYISSAGLRVLVAASHMLGEDGVIVIRNASEDVMGILEVTGFADDFICE